MSEELKVVGQFGKTLRRTGFAEASGTAEYARDVKLDRMVHVKFLHAPYAHARIVSLDTSKAKAYPGVILVFSFMDEEFKDYAIVQNPGTETKDISLWEGCMMMVGVVAEEEQTCLEALKLIDVEWEILDFYIDPEKSVDPDASLVNSTYNPNDNIIARKNYDRGDAEGAMTQSDTVFEEKLSWGRLYHAAGEPENWLYKWDEDVLTAWSHNQTVPENRAQLATWFGIPDSKIHIMPTLQGGGFGGSSFNNQYIVAALARKLNRPVKLQLTRQEDHLKGDFVGITNMKVGYSNNGAIKAFQANTIFDNGAGSALWFLDTTFACYWLAAATKCMDVKEDWRGSITNVPFSVSFRCEMSSSFFTLTKVAERIAFDLGMDPTEVALINADDPGTSLKQCIEAGKKAIDWDNKWHLPGTKMLPNGKMHGMGFVWCINWGANAMAACAGGGINSDGSVCLYLARADVGNSPFETYAMVASEVLGISVDKIHWGKDSNSVYALAPNSGSWGCTANVSVIKEVAEKLRAKLIGFAENAFGVPGDEIDIADSIVFVKNDPSKSYTVAEILAHQAGSASAETDNMSAGGAIFATVDTRYTPKEPDHFHNAEEHQRVYQAHFVEVEVDPETGAVDLINSAVVNDIGQAIRPESIHGQQYGGFCMGWGRNLAEECIYDPNTGAQLNNNLLDYKFSTLLDVGNIEAVIVESKQGPGEYGNIGIGELPAVVGGTVINNAIGNAIGKRILKNPIYPQDILAALGKI
jgi:xanthine dehydrogenase molybdenum-binding subunit